MSQNTPTEPSAPQTPELGMHTWRVGTKLYGRPCIRTTCDDIGILSLDFYEAKGQAQVICDKHNVESAARQAVIDKIEREANERYNASYFGDDEEQFASEILAIIAAGREGK